MQNHRTVVAYSWGDNKVDFVNYDTRNWDDWGNPWKHLKQILGKILLEDILILLTKNGEGQKIAGDLT